MYTVKFLSVSKWQTEFEELAKQFRNHNDGIQKDLSGLLTSVDNNLVAETDDKLQSLEECMDRFFRNVKESMSDIFKYFHPKEEDGIEKTEAGEITRR